MTPRIYAVPVQNLPSIALGMISDLDNNTPAPCDLAMTVILTKMAAAVQGNYDVSPRPGMVLPTSIVALVAAESGSGKSVSERKSSAGLDKFDALRAQIYSTELLGYHSKLDAHKAARKQILRAIKASPRERHEELQHALLEHDKNSPHPPVHAQLQYSDATISGLIDGMDQWPIAYYANDESAFVIENRLADEISFINSCHSGTSAKKRTGRGSISIADPRLTVLLQMQPSIFEKMMDKHGQRLITEGFIARALVCFCIPKQYLSHPSSPFWKNTEAFNERCFQLLNATVGRDGHPVQRQVLKFDRDAQQVFEQESARIQSMKAPGGYLQLFPELAAKLPENIAKLAAIFHAFEGLHGEISAQTLQRAIAIIMWFAEEQVRVLSNPPAPPQEMQDGLKIMAWLANYVRIHGIYGLPRNYLLRYGPGATRSANRLDAALCFLWRRGYLHEGRTDNTKTVHVFLSSSFFTPEWIAHWSGPNPGFPT